jgi:hypothetical protein
MAKKKPTKKRAAKKPVGKSPSPTGAKIVVPSAGGYIVANDGKPSLPPA